MDRLHEELKQPIMVYSRVSCDTSDESDEPSHQAKRLLGGTCVQNPHRHGKYEFTVGYLWLLKDHKKQPKDGGFSTYSTDTVYGMS
jgi:hypothetical protein